MKMFLKHISLSILILFVCLLTSNLTHAKNLPDGTKERPLRVMLVPADGGTDDGTKADFLPIFNAISRTTGLHFDIKVGHSYSAVVEAMCNQIADIAFFGAVTYLQAHQRGCAKLLAVTVEKGQSVYYAGMFAKADSPMKSIKDLKGKKVAFGDVNSTSSFVYPVAMLLDAGINPSRDLGAIFLTGSHANSLKSLQDGLVDVACASFDSYEKAVKQGAIDPAKVRVLVKSEPIPNPPLAIHPKLPKAIQDKLINAFNTVHTSPGINPDMIRGYGGKKVDRYETNITDEMMLVPGKKLQMVNDTIKAEIISKAGKR